MKKSQDAFEAWYFSETGIAYQDAKARGVNDLQLMSRCWQAAVKHANSNGDVNASYARALLAQQELEKLT